MVSEALVQSLMDSKSSCAEDLPWIWVIEELASCNQVDIPLLVDLVKKTPEISDDTGKIARELISLKILESFLVQGARNAPAVSTTSSSKVGFDPSERCEDILHCILEEKSASHLKTHGPDMSKWDLHPFLAHKRASLPKCALRQLKHALLSGNHPIVASLKEKSGLAVGNQSERRPPLDGGDSICTTPVIEEKRSSDHIDAVNSHLHSAAPRKGDNLSRDLPDESLTPAKRNRICTSVKREGQFHEDQAIMEDGCESNAKPTKRHKLVENFSASSSQNRQLADTSARTLPLNEEEHRNLEKEPNVTNCAGMEQSNSPEDRDENLASKQQPPHSDVEKHPDKSDEQQVQYDCGGGSKGVGEGASRTNLGGMEQSNSPEDTDENLASKQQPPHSDVEKHPDKSDEPQVQYNCGGGPKGVGEGASEPRASHETSGGSIQHRVHLDVDQDGFEHNFQENAPNVGQAEEGSRQNCDADASRDSDGYHVERSDIAAKKKAFLSSQCTCSQETFATTDLKELHLCVKCNKGGRLLVCSSASCPLVVHKSCLGSAAYVDSRCKFFCPFCSYSRAISEYLEAEKNVSAARNDLVTFVGSGTEKQSKEVPEKSCSMKPNQSGEDDNLQEGNELSENKNPGNVASNPQHGEIVEDKQAAELLASFASGEKTVDWAKGTTQDILRKDNQEGESTGNGCQSLGGGQEQNAAKGSNANEKHAETRSKTRASHLPETDLHHQPTCSPSTDVEGTSDGENDSSGASKFFIGFRKVENQCLFPAIPQSRRKKLPWTLLEEQKLKEGMKKFHNANDKNIPWKKILEFGADVFHKARTTVDLKDKWRNINKGSPKLE